MARAIVAVSSVAVAARENEPDAGGSPEAWNDPAPSEQKIQEPDGPTPWIHTTKAEMFFGGWIILNAIILAIECDYQTHDNEGDAGWIFIESVFNIVFLVEVVLRVVAEKAAWPCSFWNLMDAALVLIGIIDCWILRAVDSDTNVGFFTLLRVFRLLRLLRVIRVLKVLRSNKELLLLIQGMGAAMRAMSWGMLLLFICNFISALLVTKILGKKMFTNGWFTYDLEYSEDDPDGYNTYDFHFGTLPRSMFTLFTFTMEFQGDMARETFMDGAWVTYFLMAYMFVTCLALLQVVGGVIVESILSISAENHHEERAEEKERELKKSKDMVEQLYDALDSDGTGKLEYKEVNMDNDSVRKLLQKCGIAPPQADEVFQLVRDRDGIIPRDQFVQGALRLKTPIDAKDLLKIECDIGQCMSQVVKSIQRQDDMLAGLLRLESAFDQKGK